MCCILPLMSIMKTLSCSPKPAFSKIVPKPLIYFDRKLFTSVLEYGILWSGVFLLVWFLVLLFVCLFEGCAGGFLSSCFTSFTIVFQAVFLKKEHHSCSLDLVRQNLAAGMPLECLCKARSELTVPSSKPDPNCKAD